MNYNDYSEPEHNSVESFEKNAIEDVKQFFLDKNHWVYQYGSPSSSTITSPYHRKQIEVLFEKKYFHWVTDRAVNTLLKEGFLKELKTDVAHFVYRFGVRYVKREIRKREKLIQRYSDPIITKAIGDYAELLFLQLLRIYGSKIIGRHANEYKGRKWTKTDHNLDVIIEKGGMVYGIEIKNTLGYIEKEEFDTKLEMCGHFNIIPVFIMRFAPAIQIQSVKRLGGYIILSKTQIYPPGQELLVKEIWDFMRLPVAVWKEIPKKIESQIARL